MKKVFVVVLSFFMANAALAQLANGSTAPDFTFTDINGVTQNLYTYLNQGKYVAIDVSTTWCSPCWAYHNSRVMDSLYTLHDDAGDHTWKVLFIEGDGGTDLADVHGTGTSTQGDWTAGTLFPIINPPSGIALNDFNMQYVISGWPTFFLICPNKKVYQDTLNFGGNKPPVKTWEYVANVKCYPAGLDNLQDNDPLTIQPNPAKEIVTLYFGLNSMTEVSVVITNILGQVLSAKNLGALSPGDQLVKYDVSQLQAGIYIFTVTDGKGRFVRKKVSIQ
jgi:hypothetical protein